MSNPLNLDPVRPEVDVNGELANPIGANAIGLDPHMARSYRELDSLATYSTGRFEYLTDANALPARVRGVLQLERADRRVRHAAPQRDIGLLGQGREGRWHGGHIVAVSLGGFASGPNLFPQSANFNQSAYSRLEQGWRHALRDGALVGVDISLTEGPEPHMPEFVIVTHWEDDIEYTTPFLNEPDAQ